MDRAPLFFLTLLIETTGYERKYEQPNIGQPAPREEDVHQGKCPPPSTGGASENLEPEALPVQQRGARGLRVGGSTRSIIGLKAEGTPAAPRGTPGIGCCSRRTGPQGRSHGICSGGSPIARGARVSGGRAMGGGLSMSPCRLGSPYPPFAEQGDDR